MSPLSGLVEYVRWRAERYAAGRRAYSRRTPAPPPAPRHPPLTDTEKIDLAMWELELEP